MPETPPHAPHSPQQPTGAPHLRPGEGGTATGPHSAAERVPMRLREPAVTGHWPAVSRRHDGTWAVHCSSCSARAGDYVYGGCHPDDWPPQVLADPAEVRAAVYAELFGTPGQLADRKAEPGRPDDPAEVCERVAPRHHERQVRAKVEQEIRAIAPADRNPAGYSTTVAAAMEIARGGPDA